VIINPNNPTGAVYPKEILESIIDLARKHKLMIFSDEIYDKILYDNTTHTSIASLADDLVFVTMNGLSKTYRVAGFRSGWMIISGAKHRATDFMEGLTMLSSMRLCCNVPAQFAIQTSLGGYQSIYDLTRPGGRLYEQRELFYNALCDIPGISCVKPKGALYFFPRLDQKKFSIKNDRQFVLDLLLQQKVLLVEGTAFNWPQPDHFRVVFLPRVDEIKIATQKIRHFLETYHQ
jgi:alanine-synthesizing transaminase